MVHGQHTGSLKKEYGMGSAYRQSEIEVLYVQVISQWMKANDNSSFMILF
jgi:hypothetical protein